MLAKVELQFLWWM